MRNKKGMSIKYIKTKWFILKNRMLLILLSILFFIISYPIVQMYAPSALSIIEISFNLLLLCGAYPICKHKYIKTALVFTPLMILALFIFGLYLKNLYPLLAGLILEIALLAIVVIIITQKVLSYKKIRRENISGTINIYLLLGLIWAIAYTVIELSLPKSFNFAHDLFNEHYALNTYQFYLSQFLYSTYITLSTIGFGDIIPTNMVATFFTVTEAITGKIFLIFLIVRIVHLQIKSSLIGNINHQTNE